VGTFRVDVEIALPGRHPRWTSVERLLVDSGAELTWLPEDGLNRLSVSVFKSDTFLTADGRAVTRDVGIVLLRHGEFRTVDEVVFAKPGDLRLLGARTLEGFNARVDARRKRLVAAGPRTAAACSAYSVAAGAASSMRTIAAGGADPCVCATVIACRASA
jgi:predicted aspartyl protease